MLWYRNMITGLGIHLAEKHHGEPFFARNEMVDREDLPRNALAIKRQLPIPQVSPHPLRHIVAMPSCNVRYC